MAQQHGIVVRHALIWYKNYNLLFCAREVWDEEILLTRAIVTCEKVLLFY